MGIWLVRAADDRRILSPETVVEAREMMALGAGINDIALGLGLRSCDLDYSLWHYLSVSNDDLTPPRRPDPMF